MSQRIPKADSSVSPSGPVYPDINTLRQAIPKHCFEPSVLISMSYLVRDVVLIGTLGWAAAHYIPSIDDAALRATAWILYGFSQGLICTGLWILGHEAGHGAFSKHPLLNDVAGFLTHSSLMVPYYSWKFSHHRHHKFTGHMEKDMAFVPKTRADYEARLSFFNMEFLEDTPVFQAISLISHQLFGWIFYLLFNVSAGCDSQQKPTSSLLGRSHFDPNSAVFRPSEAPYIALSDVGLGLMFLALYKLSGVIDVPHFEAEHWTFVKGALATVDRDFGFIGRHLFHGIIEHHVVHHLFPRIPFYYAEEATDALKPVLGDLYHRDDRSFLGQLWSNFTQCKYVAADESVPGALKWAQKSN
ncbi:hypothetical protein G3M48_002492 [Beauveria asiatica]|uniref:Fatty acid desaturase domain-containing protein n=1 Tax=Beauveria asiatica TaxID=1069075 RepID=A0AAW0RXK1_9HYPO